MKRWGNNLGGVYIVKEATRGFDIQLSGYWNRDEQMRESDKYIVTVLG